jgi:hypothetical protein
MAEERKDQPAPNSTPDAAKETAATGLAPGASAIPNRDRRRDPPVIDARPGDVRVVSSPASAAGPVDASKLANEATTKAGAEKSGPLVGTSKEESAPATAPTSAANATAGSGKPAGEIAAKPSTGPEAKLPASDSKEKPQDFPKAASAGAGKPTANQPAPPAQAAKGSRGLVAGLLGGIAGGALALAGGYVLISPRLVSQQQVESLVAAGSGKTAGEMNATLSAAQKKASDESARQAATIEDIAKRLIAAEGATKKLLSDVEAIRTAAATPPAAPAPIVDIVPLENGLTDLEKRVAEIEKSLSAPKTATRASDPDVKPPPAPGEAAPAQQNPAPPPALIADVAALAERLKGVENRPAPRMPDLAPLQTRLQQIEQRLAPLAEKIEPIETALAQGRDAAGSQAKSIETQRARADAAALAVVGRGLTDAVASGAPYASLLGAARALGADADALKALEPFAEKGVPVASALTAQFASIANSLIDGDAKPDPNASLTEKLAASAGKLVRVRPADDTTEETPAAVATRINVALRTQKFDDALALYAKLPENARARAKSWADVLRGRVEAARASEAIVNAALARLARP